VRINQDVLRAYLGRGALTGSTVDV
jgi:hypothetical protein